MLRLQIQYGTVPVPGYGYLVLLCTIVPGIPYFNFNFYFCDEKMLGSESERTPRDEQ